jgi:hypothetical protein
MPILICLLYLAIHAGLFFALLRGRRALDSEHAIFIYHFASSLVLTCAFGTWALVRGGSDAWAWFTSAVMLHGIYSLSFLELWALADDSYSLAILEIIDRSGAAAGPALMQRLEAIGTGKQASRLGALQAIGFVREVGDGSFALTPAGRAAVVLGRTLLSLANVRKYG